MTGEETLKFIEQIREDYRKRLLADLKKEQERSKLGFIQYKRLSELLGETNEPQTEA